MMSNQTMDDERFEATLRGFLADEANHASAAAVPVGEVLDRLRGEPVAPAGRGLISGWTLIAAGLLLAGLLGIALAVGSGLVKLPVVYLPPTPSASATAEPAEPAIFVPLPRSQATTPTPSPRLNPGRFTVGSRAQIQFALPVEQGWSESSGPAYLSPASGSDPDLIWISNSDGHYVQIATPDAVYADACHRWNTATVPIGSSPDSFLAALARSITVPGASVSETTAITVGGQPGLRIRISITADSDFLSCDMQRLLLWHLPSDVDGVPAKDGIVNGSTRLLDQASFAGGEWQAVFDVLDVQGAPAVVSCGGCGQPDTTLLDTFESVIAWSGQASGQPSSAPTAPPASASGPLLPYGYLVPDQPYRFALSEDLALTVQLSVPEPLTWWVDRPEHRRPDTLILGDGQDELHLPLDEIAIEVPEEVYLNPCTGWFSSVKPTPEAWAAALYQGVNATGGLVASRPVTTSIGGLPAQELSIRPAEPSVSACTTTTRDHMLWTLRGGLLDGPAVTAEGLAGVDPTTSWVQTTELFIVDVRGTPVIVVATDPFGVGVMNQPQSLVAIVDSIRWP